MTDVAHEMAQLYRRHFTSAEYSPSSDGLAI